MKMKYPVYSERTAAILITLKDPKHATMKLRHPVLVLILMVLVYSCICRVHWLPWQLWQYFKAGGSDSHPGVSPPRYHRRGSPRPQPPAGTHFSLMMPGENAVSSGEKDLVQKYNFLSPTALFH